MTMAESPAKFTAWQQALVSHRRRDEEPDSATVESVRERQAALGEALDNGSAALAGYLRSELDLEGKTLDDYLPLPRPLAADEVFYPPIELERDLHDAWESLIGPGDASQPAFWTVCHIRWLEEGNLGDDPDALFSTGVLGKRVSEPDARTRDLLRHVGGLPHVRGNVSVFSDCPLARAWWRRHLAIQASESARGLSVEAAHQALHKSNQIWEELVRLSVRRVTVISQPKVRASIIASIASTPGVQREDVATIARGLARLGLHYSLDQVSWDDLQGVIRQSLS